MQHRWPANPAVERTCAKKTAQAAHFHVRPCPIMSIVDSLISKLESSISSERDRAAIKLMDIGDPAAVAPLLKAISNPENINHRGTLVYALGAFDCRNHIEVLVDLALTGNFEVSTGAFSIIADSEQYQSFEQRIKVQLCKYDQNTLPFEHSHTAFLELTELVQGCN